MECVYRDVGNGVVIKRNGDYIHTLYVMCFFFANYWVWVFIASYLCSCNNLRSLLASSIFIL